MIRLTRLNHVPLVLNSDLIEHIEDTPDTVISMTTGQKIIVLEDADAIVRKVVEFRRAIASGLCPCGPPGTAHTRQCDRESGAGTDGGQEEQG